jgi:hypothetical protein
MLMDFLALLMTVIYFLAIVASELVGSRAGRARDILNFNRLGIRF